MSNVLPEHARKNRQKFINELKSGDYTQIAGKYHGDEDCFCALGLCLYKVAGFTNANFFRNGETDISITESLGKKMQMNEDQGIELVLLNDEAAFDFNQIADSLVERGFLENRDYNFSDEYLEVIGQVEESQYHLSLG